MLENQVDEFLQRVKITAPDGVSPAEALKRVKQTTLARLVGQAVDAKVVVSYQDWLQMSELERAMWTQAQLEHEQRYWGMLATATGNIGMAKRALHLEDPEAQEQDAVDIGLRVAGLAP